MNDTNTTNAEVILMGGEDGLEEIKFSVAYDQRNAVVVGITYEGVSLDLSGELFEEIQEAISISVE